MQKRGIRNGRELVEYLGQPQAGKANGKPAPQKKSWGKPLVTGIIVVAACVGAAFAFSKMSCEHGGQPAAKERNRAEAERNKTRNERVEKLRQIKRIIKARQQFMEKNPNWQSVNSAGEEKEYTREELDFRADLEEMDREELISLLMEQRNKISELKNEYEEDDSDEARMEIAHEEIKRGDIEERLDEIEIVERGYLDMHTEELEVLIAELDRIIAEEEENYYPYASDEYIDAMRNRMLAVKALGERAAWEEIFPPA